MLAGTASAAPALFTVEDVKIDVTAASALEAKNQAFEKAQKEAFTILTERALSPEARERLPEPDPSVISTLIKDFEITSEKLSRVRYIGTYTIRFDEAKVKYYFSTLGMGVASTAGRPVLVLPLYRGTEDGTILWSPENEWLEAWNRSGHMNGPVPLVIPIGDLDDVKDIGDDGDLTYNDEHMKNMLSRYRADEAVIAIAVPSETGLSVQIYRTDHGTPEYVQDVQVAAIGGAMSAETFDAAVKAVHGALQRDWKNAPRMAETKAVSRISARVPIASLQEWATIQKALRRVNEVTALDIKSLSPGEAQIDLRFKGDIERLYEALRKAGLGLSAQGDSSGYEIRLGVAENTPGFVYPGGRATP